MKIIFMLPTGIIEYPVPEDWKPTFNLVARDVASGQETARTTQFHKSHDTTARAP